MNTSKIIRFFICLILASLVFAPGAVWAAGNTVMYQGALAKPDGTAVPDGTYLMTFTVFDALEAGASLWVESGLSVQVTGGAFAVELGSTTPFGDLFESGAARWLAIAADLGAGMNTFDPRVPFTMVPHAGDAATLEGNHASDFADAVHGHNLENLDGAMKDAQVPDDITINHAATAGDADMVDGKHAASFSLTSHNHILNELSGSVTDTQVPDDITVNNADTVDGNHAASFWNILGNAGTTPPTQFLGTTDNMPLELRVDNTRAFRIEPNPDSPNLIGGFNGNTVTTDVKGATIGGGGASTSTNRVTDDYGTIGGGGNNQAGDNAGPTSQMFYATVSGGAYNNATDSFSTVGGGLNNDASGASSIVGGGESNVASGSGSTVGGGAYNNAQAKYSTISGGGPSNEASPETTNNRVTDNYGTISGGGNNQAGDNAGTNEDGTYATVGGGVDNTASDTGSTVGGGRQNDAIGEYSTVGGGSDNTASGIYATVGGGFYNDASHSSATVGGGYLNTASGSGSTVGGGYNNDARAKYSTIAGGGPSDEGSPTTTNNRVTDDYGTIGGGRGNQAGDDAGTTYDQINATVGGGFQNRASSADSTVSGGYDNRASSSGTTIGGGYFNITSGEISTVGGGTSNYATGDRSTVSGGEFNRAGGSRSTIAGGSFNTADGNFSFAVGRRAKANHNGSFVWGDSTDDDVASTADDQFTARAAGGVRFFSNAVMDAGVELAAGGGAWTTISDRNKKENFVPVDCGEVLDKISQLPLSTWNYKAQDPSIRHMGPMAQDLHAAFGLGETDTGITTIDADGVALAAIQGLNQRLEEKVEETKQTIAEKDKEIAALRADLEAVKSMVREISGN